MNGFLFCENFLKIYLKKQKELNLNLKVYSFIIIILTKWNWKLFFLNIYLSMSITHTHTLYKQRNKRCLHKNDSVWLKNLKKEKKRKMFYAFWNRGWDLYCSLIQNNNKKFFEIWNWQQSLISISIIIFSLQSCFFVFEIIFLYQDKKKNEWMEMVDSFQNFFFCRCWNSI